jgi:hypothetical protein
MDIARALGATEPAGTYPIAIFIPSVDRDGAPIDQAYWIKEALTVLGRRFGGATAMPPGSGVWRDDEQGGQLKSDESVIVFCLAKWSEVTPTALQDVRRFLHRMGRDARQGEVGVVMEGQYFGIREYDAPAT